MLQIAVLMEDKEMVNSYMEGKPWKAGKFSSSLRLSLWSEHLGLRAGEVSNSSLFSFPELVLVIWAVSFSWFLVFNCSKFFSSDSSNNRPSC